MKILFMADVLPSPDSGAAGTEYQTIAALRQLGHEVDAVWGHEFPHRVANGNLHYLLELPRAYEQEMVRRLRQKSFDVIHVNQPHGYRAAKTLRRLHRKCVFIHRSHGVELRVESELAPWRQLYAQDDRSFTRRFASKVLARALRRNSLGIAAFADGHIVSAGQCRDFLQQSLNVPSERIAVIPQAPPSAFHKSPASPMTQTRLKRILYVSQFAFFKAPVVVADAINRLSAADEQLRFTWVCSREHHNQVRYMLDKDAKERVELLDWMPQPKLMDIYNAHGIFLFPSFVEGFGKVFLEAMSRGLCVVAADNSGARDVIINGVNGMLAPTGAADVMVLQCLDLIQNPDSAVAMSRLAAQSARTYTWQRVAKETVAFYEDRLVAKSHELTTVNS